MKFLVGKVKNDCSEDYKGFEGIELILVEFWNKEEFAVAGVLKLDDMEKFYKTSYEKSLKDFISDDYEYCLWYVLNEDCELTCRINKSDIENLREFTKEDDKLYGKNLKEFKRIHNFSGIEKKFKDEEKAEKLANREFEKKDKIKILVLTRDGYKRVNAVIYKGFAIHNPVGMKYCGSLNTAKTITILDGENKGMVLVNSCFIRNCKKLINEVRKAIGDKSITNEDASIIAPIVHKY